MKIPFGVVLMAAAIAAGGARMGAQQEMRTVWDGVYTPEQSTRGKALYAQVCANCHGAGLEGIDMSPALTGGAFTSNWNDLTVGDLAERIRTTMPMDRPGTMTRDEVADVTAFMLEANKFPSGETALPEQVPAMRQIRILAQRPTASH
jgi:S-disulfanyl-L-cysteine oxidoreductase SoxD